MKPSTLNNLHKKLADKLVSLHKTDDPYNRLPPYDYQQIQKGLTCKKCISFSVSVLGHKVVCSVCGCHEAVSASVIRSLEEFMLLFPDRKITTKEIQEWCHVVVSEKRISRILVSNFKINGVKRWMYFE